jgi:hypothetical protein
MVDQDQVGIERMAVLAQFVRLAAADVIARIGALDARSPLADDGRTGRAREFGELLRGLGVMVAGLLGQQEQRALTFAGSFEQGMSPRCGTPFNASAGTRIQGLPGCKARGPAAARVRRAPRPAPDQSSPATSLPGVPAAALPSGRPTRTLREGTTVEIACL